MASEAQLTETLESLFQQLNATESAINSILALPTRQRQTEANQRGLRALEGQKQDILQNIEQTQKDLKRLTEIAISDADAPAISPNRTAFGVGGVRGNALRVRELEQQAELEAAEEDLAQARLDGKTGRAITNRERNVAALRRELEDTQQALGELGVPTRRVPDTAEQRLQNQVENSAPAPVEQADLGDADDPVIPVENPEEPAQSNQAALEKLRAQSAVQQNREPQGTGDWRVKLRLASGAEYLYKQQEPGAGGLQNSAGILAPLIATDGIVFPYTPSIQILYAAEYNQYQPTHSNYQNYFYKGSKVGEVVMTANFTAQDTEEANYLLAVIHFLKSATKMFYGQDQQRGSPPPLLFLTGLGEYQFNEAPCVISQFNYVLPDDVDYIRANVEQIRAGTLQSNLRNKNTGSALTTWSSSINRLLTSNLFGGAENPTSKTSSQTANLSSDTATYVPTKLQMTITLLPVQNRLQVSQDFSLKEYANGSLIKGGFW